MNKWKIFIINFVSKTIPFHIKHPIHAMIWWKHRIKEKGLKCLEVNK
jgi:hypothetical protein